MTIYGLIASLTLPVIIVISFTCVRYLDTLTPAQDLLLPAPSVSSLFSYSDLFGLWFLSRVFRIIS